jgi:hypothetical protein
MLMHPQKNLYITTFFLGIQRESTLNSRDALLVRDSLRDINVNIIEESRIPRMSKLGIVRVGD